MGASKAMVGDKIPAGEMNLGLLSQRLSFRLNTLQSLLGSEIVKRFAPFRLPVGSFTTMALMNANSGCSRVDLARAARFDKSALVAIVDELERRGLAARGRSPTDRRRNSLSLSPDGEKLMQEMFQVAHTAERPIRDDLSPAELAQLFSLLERAFRSVANRISD